MGDTDTLRQGAHLEWSPSRRSTSSPLREGETGIPSQHKQGLPERYLEVQQLFGNPAVPLPTSSRPNSVASEDSQGSRGSGRKRPLSTHYGLDKPLTGVPLKRPQERAHNKSSGDSGGIPNLTNTSSRIPLADTSIMTEPSVDPPGPLDPNSWNAVGLGPEVLLRKEEPSAPQSPASSIRWGRVILVGIILAVVIMVVFYSGLYFGSGGSALLRQIASPLIGVGLAALSIELLDKAKPTWFRAPPASDKFGAKVSDAKELEQTVEPPAISEKPNRHPSYGDSGLPSRTPSS